jgi:DNA-binding NarL/FixJ family response regulator
VGLLGAVMAFGCSLPGADREVPAELNQRRWLDLDAPPEGYPALGLATTEGLDAARQIKRQMPALKVIFLTVSEDPDLAAEAFRAGVSGYLLKNSATWELLRAIEEVSQGRSYVTPLVTKGLVGSFLRGPGPEKRNGELSQRRREVLLLLAERHTMKATARILSITPRTVAFHKYGMMAELGIKSGAGLVQYASKQHIVSV